jgi:hypothetical protein
MLYGNKLLHLCLCDSNLRRFVKLRKKDDIVLDEVQIGFPRTSPASRQSLHPGRHHVAVNIKKAHKQAVLYLQNHIIATLLYP